MRDFYVVAGFGLEIAGNGFFVVFGFSGMMIVAWVFMLVLVFAEFDEVALSIFVRANELSSCVCGD